MGTFTRAYLRYKAALDNLGAAKRDLENTLLQKMRIEIQGLETVEEVSIAVVEENKVILTASYDRNRDPSIRLHADIYSDTIILYP